jgi:hypothetical protein
MEARATEHGFPIVERATVRFWSSRRQPSALAGCRSWGSGDLDDAECVTDPEQVGRTQWSERVGREVAPAKRTRR